MYSGIPGDYVKHFTQALEHFDGIKTIREQLMNWMQLILQMHMPEPVALVPFRCNTV